MSFRATHQHTSASCRRVYIHRMHDKAKLKAAQQPWHRDGGIRERLTHDVLDELPDGRREVDAWTWHIAFCDDHESAQSSSTRRWCAASGHPRDTNFLHPSFALHHHVIPLCTHIQLWSIIISVLLSPRLLRFLHYTEDRAENFWIEMRPLWTWGLRRRRSFSDNLSSLPLNAKAIIQLHNSAASESCLSQSPSDVELQSAENWHELRIRREAANCE